MTLVGKDLRGRGRDHGPARILGMAANLPVDRAKRTAAWVWRALRPCPAPLNGRTLKLSGSPSDASGPLAPTGVGP